MDSLVQILANRIKLLVPDLKNQVAAFPTMPDPKRVRAHFHKPPYALVFSNGFKVLTRDPVDVRVPVVRRLIEYSFDVALAFDPQLELQDPDGLLAETLPQDVCEAISNFVAGCWQFDWTEYKAVVNTDSEAMYALSVVAAGWIDFSATPPDQVPEGVKLVHVKSRGSIA